MHLQEANRRAGPSLSCDTVRAFEDRKSHCLALFKLQQTGNPRARDVTVETGFETEHITIEFLAGIEVFNRNRHAHQRAFGASTINRCRGVRRDAAAGRERQQANQTLHFQIDLQVS